MILKINGFLVEEECSDTYIVMDKMVIKVLLCSAALEVCRFFQRLKFLIC